MFQTLKKFANRLSSNNQENDLSKIDYTKDVIDMSKLDYVKDVITMSDKKVFTDNQKFSQAPQTQNAPKYTTIYLADVLKQHKEELENESKNLKNKDNQITLNRVQTGKVTTFEKQKDGSWIEKGKESNQFAKLDRSKLYEHEKMRYDMIREDDNFGSIVTPTFERQKDGLLIAKGKKSDFDKHDIDTWGFVGDFEDEKDTWGAFTSIL